MDANWTIRTASGVASVPAAAWDALVPADHVFERHAFLAHLEASGSVGADAGWVPVPVLVEDADGRLIGAAPAYVKDHSYGEYIFDWGWADAARRHGIPYFPKVVVAVPVTPATGPRLLVHPDASVDAVRAALVHGARALADAIDAGGVHWLFTRPDEAAMLGTAGHLPRLTHQFVWTDHGFGSFDGYLDAMTSKRRKEVRRERRQAAESGYDLAVEPLAALSDDDLAALRRCYEATIADHWAQPYLTPAWFAGLRDALGVHGLVATARDGGRLVAASLAFRAGGHLYGRYWGSLVDAPALHFELCYYRLIAYALEHGITRVEAGAQGAHKVPRGFLPVFTHSAHWLRHPGLRSAVAAHIAHETRGIRDEAALYATRGPYRDGIVRDAATVAG